MVDLTPGPLTNRPVLRQALPPIALFAAIALSSIVGFVALGGVSVVEAAYWLVSPANVGIHFEDTDRAGLAARALTVASRFGLVIAGLWIGQTVVSALFGGQITEELKRVQQERTIESFDDHVVVCGYGMFGRTIVEQLEANYDEIVVIEQDDDIVITAERDGHVVVDGDARQEAVLRRAGVDRANTVVAAVDDSNVNIQIAIVAHGFAPDAELVVRVGDEEYSQVARRAGADSVVIPEVMSGEDVAGELKRRSGE